MAGSAKRERQLARERYERQQQRRAAAVARRKRNQQIVAVVVAVAVVVLGVTFLANKLNGNDSTAAASKPKKSAAGSPSASPSASASPSPSVAAGGCTYTKSAEKASKDVGLPTYDKAKAATYKKPFTATVKTNVGTIVIAMDAAAAPCTTNSFRHLATSKFFDSSPCHRLTTSNIYVLQCGDPTGSGSGGPGYGFGVENAPADGNYPAGTVAMARTQDPNSNGSQFFLVYKDTALPDANGYSIFGKITTGLDVVAKVAAAESDSANGDGDGAPKMKVTIESVTIGKS